MKIVLTGGPSAGKTSIAAILQRMHFNQVAIVPEAASILFSGGFPRRSDADRQRCQQKAIYFVQRELEQISELDFPGRTLICDRGSLDALAYWPGAPDDFFTAIRSQMTVELGRYDWVIHLDTAPPFDYKSTALRVESSEEANRINARVKEAWQLHPRRLIINKSGDFVAKINITARTVAMILHGAAIDDVRNFVNASNANP